MNGKEIVLLRTKSCDWCNDAEGLLSDLGKKCISVDICENPLGKAMAKKVCGGKQPCLLIDGKPMNKLDKSKIGDELLD